jgi:hypothetical protein
VPNSKFASLVLAAIAAGAPPAYALQAPEPNPTSTAPTSPAPTSTASAAAAAGTTGSSSEADEAAALIAQANAAAAARAAEAAAPAAPPTKIQPSLAARKKATEYGFHAEVYDGKTMFCKQDAALGSRIKSTRCMGAYEFEDYAVQLKIARDMMQSKTQCQGGKVLGGPCGGIP